MIKRIFQELPRSYWIFVIIVSVIFLPVTFSKISLLYKGVPINYTAYQDVTLTVNKWNIEGKLNEYISTKDKNDKCYVENCGFPSEGEYKVKEITFIEVADYVYVLKNCLDKSTCFYNYIPNSFIEEIKKDKIFEYFLLSFLFFLFWLNIVVFIYSLAKEKNKDCYIELSFFKSVIRKIHPSYWRSVIITSSIFLPYVFLNFDYLSTEVQVRYFSYQDVMLKVNKWNMEGKLNKYISVKNKNDRCYVEYCGFSEEGEYEIKEITFADVADYVYIFKNCIDENHCVYNYIPDLFIEKIKKDKVLEVRTIFLGIVLFLFYLFTENWNRAEDTFDN